MKQKEQTHERLYCWNCRTRQVMMRTKRKLRGATYKCPNCGHINRKEVQPENV